MIIDFKAAKEAKDSPHFIAKSTHTGSAYCRHEKIVIDDHTRVLTCQKCDKVVDAYDYLLALADKEIKLFEAIKHLKQDQAALITAITKLKKEERNLKSRIKAAQKRRPVLDEPISPLEIKDRQSCLNEMKEKLK